MPSPVRDVRAGVVRLRYQQQCGGAELPVPSEPKAENLRGFAVDEVDDLPVSGILVLSERPIDRNTTESPAQRLDSFELLKKSSR